MALKPFQSLKAGRILAVAFALLLGLKLFDAPRNPVSTSAPVPPPTNEPAAQPPRSPEPDRPAESPSASTTDHRPASPFVNVVIHADPAEQLALATERRDEMLRLIRADPEAAVREGLSFEDWNALPDAVRHLVDRPIIGNGDLEVVIEESFPEPNHDHAHRDHDHQAEDGAMRIERAVSINGEPFEAHVYGRRLHQPTGRNLSFQGVAIDNLIALNESPIRVLGESDVPSPANCLHSDLEPHPAIDGLSVQIGNRQHVVCRAHLADVEHAWAAYDENGGSEVTPSGLPAIAESSWTQGHKTLLFMRVNFPDDLREPITEADAHELMEGVGDWFSEVSYGTTSISTTVTPLLTLPQPISYYQLVGDGQILTDARGVARAAGFETDDYDLDAVRFVKIPGFNYAGKAYVRGKGCWLQSSSLGVACHEFGHNYGLWHANHWNAENDSIIGPGTHVEYGDIFDTMGSASAGDKHFNAYSKHKLNWLADAFVRDASGGGTFRLHAFDRHQPMNGNSYALKIRRDFDRDYWVELHHLFDNNEFIQNGVLIHVDPWGESGGGTHLIDTTPGTPGGSSGKQDAALVIGRTFSDHGAGVYITPTRMFGAGADKSIEVVVKVGGFNNNEPPVVTLDAATMTAAPGEEIEFSAIASDPDEDVLAYHWDFDNLNFGPNQPVVSHAFTNPGTYVVRCRVSDMKGGHSAAAVVITVGDTTQFSVTGRILDEEGAPVEGVRVHNGKSGSGYRGGYTDGDGTYHIGRMSSGTHSLSAVANRYVAFSESGAWSNPVTLSAGANGLDFAAASLPAVYLTIEDDSLAEENNDPAIVRFHRTGSTAQSLDVIYRTSGVGSFTSDLSVSPGPVSTSPNVMRIPAGETHLDVVLTPVDDPGGEGPEPIAITLVENGAYHLGYRAEAALTIEDNDTVSQPTMSVSANSSSVDERGIEGGVDAMGFRIYRSGNRTGDITVYYELGGTATAGVDYVAPPGSVVMPAGENTVYVLFSLLEDDLVEGEETVILTLLDDPGYKRGGGSTATAYIVDNDPVTVTITATDNEMNESGTDTATFVISRVGNTEQPLTVFYSSGGTAELEVDYTLSSASATIPAGTYSTTITITGVPDAVVEGNETAVLTLTSHSTYNIGNPGLAVARITDAQLPVISLAAVDTEASETGPDTALYRITRSGVTEGEITVHLAVNGTAIPDADYIALPGTVHFADGETQIDLVVAPVEDALKEAGETIEYLVLEDPAYHRATVEPVKVSISDDDSDGVRGVGFRFAESEQSEGITAVKIPLVLSEKSSSPITVDFSVSGGTATDPDDHHLANGTVTIAANQSVGLVEFSVVNDSVAEPDETIIFTLSNPSGAVLDAIRTHTFTILDDDASVVTVTAVQVAATEDGENALVRFARVGDTADDLQVYFDLTGTAGRPSDFAFPDSPIVIPAGQMSVDVPLTANADETEEPDETVKITLTGAPGSRIGSPASALITIVDNHDPAQPLPVVTLVVTNDRAIEADGTPASIRVSRDGDLAEALEVFLAYGGAGEVSEDFVDAPVSVIIPALASEFVVSLQARDDGLEENIEDWEVSLIADSAYELGTPSNGVFQVLDSPFNEWQMLELGLHADSSPEAFALDVDTDGDGHNSFTEYAFNLDPDIADALIPMEREVRGEPEFEHTSLVIRFKRRIHRVDVAYELAFSEDLVEWISDPGYFEELRVTDDGNGVTETVEVRLLPIPIVAERRFVTLGVRKP